MLTQHLMFIPIWASCLSLSGEVALLLWKVTLRWSHTLASSFLHWNPIPLFLFKYNLPFLPFDSSTHSKSIHCWRNNRKNLPFPFLANFSQKQWVPCTDCPSSLPLTPIGSITSFPFLFLFPFPFPFPFPFLFLFLLGTALEMLTVCSLLLHPLAKLAFCCGYVSRVALFTESTQHHQGSSKCSTFLFAMRPEMTLFSTIFGGGIIGLFQNNTSNAFAWMNSVCNS